VGKNTNNKSAIMIKARKQRPPNGPGANGLRGGTNLYSQKTAIHRWQDDIGGSISYRRGFTTSAFETESQHQQLGVSLKAPAYFGAALPIELEDNSPSSALWQSNAHSGMKTGLMTAQGETHLPTMNLKYEELEKYRKQWTTDVPASRDMRFQTENRRATKSAPKQFQMPTMRLLPGTPRPLETFRERLLERHGILALSNIRFHVGVGEISCDDFKRAIANTEVKVDRFEINQIMGYFTPSTVLSADQFVRTVVAKTEGFAAASPSAKDLFDAMSGHGSIVPVDLLMESLNGEEYPEVVEGISMYISAYSVEIPGALTNSEFTLLLSDMYASRPQDYDMVITNVFSSQ
jgi:hypothetical protein